MKKYFFLLVAAILFSCSEDSAPPEPKFDSNFLLRGWSYEQYAVDGVFYPYSHEEGCNKNMFGFRNRLGQEYQFEEMLFSTENCTVAQTYLEWKAVGDYVKLYFGDNYGGRLKIIELTDEVLHFILEVDTNGDGVAEKQEILAAPYDPYGSF